jgi:hypothetical protein
MVEHPARQARLALREHRVYSKTGTVLLDYEVLGPAQAKGPKRKRR